MSTRFSGFDSGRRSRVLLALVAVWAGGWRLCPAWSAAGARLMVPELEPDRAVRLVLTNTSPTHYVIEASPDLRWWFPAAGGQATNSGLSLQHATASNHPTLFYRGAEASPRPVVVPTPDTNSTGVTLVTSDGGHIAFRTGAGLLVELTVPARALPEPVVVSATLVTNLTGLPYARGSLAAVHFEPVDLRFWGAAQLEIQLPEGIDRRDLMAYRFQADGSGFGTLPGRVLTNRVLIPITELGGYGIGLATREEAAMLFTPGSFQVTGPRPLGPAGGAEGCEADEALAANQAMALIQAALDARREAIARELSRLRQQVEAGYETDSSEVLEQIGAGHCEFYQAWIAPRWPEAQHNCALGRVLMQFTLGLERGRQLLGTADAEGCTSGTVLNDCAVMQNCLQEIRDCCETVRGASRVAAVLGLARQDQLLGSRCLSADAVEAALGECSSNAWVGTFVARQSGSETIRTGDLVEVQEYQVTFEGSVEESFELDFGIAKSIELVVVGNYTGRGYDRRTFFSSSPCLNGNTSSYFSEQISEDVTSVISRFEVNIDLNHDGTYRVWAIHFHSAESPAAPGRGYDSDYSRSVNCNGAASVQDFRHPDVAPFYGPNLPLTHGSGSTNEVSGTLTLTDPDSGPPMTTEFKWNFWRWPQPLP